MLDFLERYNYPQMFNLWKPENKFAKWLQVEIAICEGWEKLKIIPTGTAKKIKEKAKINVPRINEIENIVHHDVIAFVKSITENLGKEGKYLHYGVTSYDVVDTSLSLILRETADILLEDLKTLIKTTRSLAKKNKKTVMMGRTHGVHAEPITLALKFMLWCQEMERNFERLKFAQKDIAVGKVSGAVGTYSVVDPKVEIYVCKKLKLTPSAVSTQILQRDRHSFFVSVLALIAASCEKIAEEIRNLQHTEIAELEEPFSKGQQGSSAMPHKRNPFTCERICGLARVIKANAHVGLENVSLWHERDITNSAPERVIFSTSSILLDYILRKLNFVVANITLNKDQMQKNIELTKGVIFSQEVLHLLIAKGLSREESYTLVQKYAMQSWKEKKDYFALLLTDNKIKSLVSEKELKNVFHVNVFLHNVEKIYKRLKI